MICSKHNRVHTDEQGWTTIKTDSRRKPKSETSNQPSIDSIIATINVDINKFLKGAPEAKIYSPIPENRCIIPDETSRQGASEFNLNYRSKQKLIPPTAEETGEATAEQSPVSDMDKNKRYEQNSERVSINEVPRSNKAIKDDRKDTVEWNEGAIRSTPTSKGEEKKAFEVTTMAINGSSEANQNGMSNGEETESNNGSQMNDEDNQGQNKNKNNQEEKSNDNNNGGNNKQRVNILEPGDMDTYAFTVSWRPEQKAGKDGKIIIKKLMREMAHKTPSIIFHPTNSATSPVPRDINNINNDFPKSPANFDDYFDQMRNRDNTNQSTFMKVTMPHDEKEL
jgi:hypothetical protein